MQQKTFDLISEGNDLIAKSKTGSGKTLAFLLPMAERLALAPKTPNPRALILCPTRELANQVYKQAVQFTPQLKTACIYGGADYGPQL